MQNKSVNPSDLSKSAQFSAPQGDDIPEALRAAEAQPSMRISRTPLWLTGLGLGAIALATAGVWAWQRPSPLPTVAPPPAASPPLAAPASPTAPATPANPAASPLLGHFPYEEAPAGTLQPIAVDGTIMLRRAAAEKFLAMVQAAQADGVRLVPLSGFRSKTEQDYLFFDVKAQRGSGAVERAAVSAPPGYSEHHTGYAVDVADGTRPDTHLEVAFETTPAFQWLQRNAAYYNFELSFPRNNPQGVSYEPWHWRFVGDRHSLETFYKARTDVRPVPPVPPAQPVPPTQPQ